MAEEKEICNVTVVDAIMGAGKTSWAIDYINQHTDENILYIAPYLSETERIKNSVCRDFKTPKHRGEGKSGDILNLLKNGHDIASTHVLFSRFTDEHRAAIQRGDYTLIVDETVEAVAPYELAKDDDIQYLLDKGSITIDKDGVIEWIDRDYDTRFDPIKDLAKSHALFRVNKKILIWQYPPEIFKDFKWVYVLTYMFNSSTMKYYFDLSGIKYELKSVEQKNNEYILTDYYEASRDVLKEKIHIYNNSDINKIFPQKITSLSSSWYKNSDNIDYITKTPKSNLQLFPQ